MITGLAGSNILKPEKDFKSSPMDVGMSSIQAYKSHKQEGTIAATKLVCKVHKQGALSTSSQASLHQWLHSTSNNQAVYLICCNLELISILCSHALMWDAWEDVPIAPCLCTLLVSVRCCCYSSLLCFV